MKIFTLSLLLFISSQTIFAQIVGSNVFIKGTYVEAGINSCGAFGSSALPPVGYHPTEGTGVSFVADSDMDGWEIGSPLYCGDYSVPGSPVEGWAIQIGASVWVNTDQGCVGSDIPGSITDYSTAPVASSATWEGNIVSPSLNIQQKTVVKTNKRFLTTTITLTNTGATALNDVYYMRNIDPDNDQPWSADFTTANTIVSNPPIGSDALVTSEGLTYGCYLGIGARNSNARVSYGNFSTADGLPSDVWNGTSGYSIIGSSTGDIAKNYFIQHLGLMANASYIYSKVNLGKENVGQSDNRPLQGQSPYSINAGIFFEDKELGLQANLLYNVIGKRIAFVGTDDNPDIYEMSRHILDFNIQYRFKKNVELSLSANDLINQPILFLQDGNRDKKWNRNSDQVFQKYQPGQTISLGVKYNF